VFLSVSLLKNQLTLVFCLLYLVSLGLIVAQCSYSLLHPASTMRHKVPASTMSQRAYVRVMRAQIAAAKVASLNSGASEHASGAAGDDVSSA